MKRFGRWIPVILMTVVLCLICGTSLADRDVSGREYPARVMIGGVSYEVQDDAASDLLYVEREDHIEILQYIGFSSTVTIPDSIHGKPVTVVGLSACAIDGIGQYFQGVKKVILPNTIVKLSRNAFHGLECLQTVEGLENVQELEAYAFENSWLPEAHFSTKLKSIDQHSFSGNHLEKVTIPI